MRKVVVENYCEQWPEMFNQESRLLSSIFGEELLAIHHIGSTSVPGLKAKPIIDIMPVVKNIRSVDRYNEQMAGLGYEVLGENGLPGRRYFRKGGENRTHHVHVFQHDNLSEINRHLAVRDFLRAHPEKAEIYGNLKEKLAQRNPADIEAYMDGKDDFVKELEKKALLWKFSG